MADTASALPSSHHPHPGTPDEHRWRSSSPAAASTHAHPSTTTTGGLDAIARVREVKEDNKRLQMTLEALLDEEAAAAGGRSSIGGGGGAAAGAAGDNDALASRTAVLQAELDDLERQRRRLADDSLPEVTEHLASLTAAVAAEERKVAALRRQVAEKRSHDEACRRSRLLEDKTRLLVAVAALEGTRAALQRDAARQRSALEDAQRRQEALLEQRAEAEAEEARAKAAKGRRPSISPA
eukprot:Rhum_TRINITY_DN21423_c0_g1::Rhum_TRINITY_DN21423_c0_g1_i1::g.174047::m.174047